MCAVLEQIGAALNDPLVGKFCKDSDKSQIFKIVTILVNIQKVFRKYLKDSTLWGRTMIPAFPAQILRPRKRKTRPELTRIKSLYLQGSVFAHTETHIFVDSDLLRTQQQQQHTHTVIACDL